MDALNARKGRSFILSKDQIDAVFASSAQVIELLLQEAARTWGTKCVWVAIQTPYSDVVIDNVFFAPDQRQVDGEPDLTTSYKKVALRKLKLSARTCMNTREVIEEFPWMLDSEDYCTLGGVYNNGISVGVAGSTAEVDQLIAETILKSIEIAARLRTLILKQARGDYL